MTVKSNTLDQSLDIAGSLTQTSNMQLSDESLYLGAPLSGQTGINAIITAGSPAIVSGLTGMTERSQGNWLTIQGSGLGNNGTYPIINFINATSVQITAPLIVNEAGLTWIERKSYSLEDDLNYIRTDREAIKGVGYNQAIPTYYRCTDLSNPVPANLANISGKTTDAKSFVTDVKFEGELPVVGSSFITLSAAGMLKHADSIDITGVPINDGYDVGNYNATYAAVISDGYAKSLIVLSGINAGNRIFGRMRAGVSISPNSVEVEWRSVPIGEPITNSVPYTWEAGNQETVSIWIPYRECLSDISDTAFRRLLVNGVIADTNIGGGSGGNLPIPTQIGQVLFAIDGTEFRVATPVTSTYGWLVSDLGVLIVNEEV